MERAMSAETRDESGTVDPTRLTHKQATNRMKDAQDELERLAAKEERTAQDDVSWAELVREIEVLEEHVRSLERADHLERVRSRVQPNPTSTGGRGGQQGC